NNHTDSLPHYFISLQCISHHRPLHSFPTRRSSDLKRRSAEYYKLINNLFDTYLGELPEKFTYKGKEYTPKSFAESLEISECILRSEEHTSELQSRFDLVCRLLLEKKKISNIPNNAE